MTESMTSSVSKTRRSLAWGDNGGIRRESRPVARAVIADSLEGGGRRSGGWMRG